MVGNQEKLLEGAVNDVVNYFTYFNYSPSLEEIHKYLPVKITQKQLKIELKKLVNQGKLICKSIRNLKFPSTSLRAGQIRNFAADRQLYTLPGHSISARLIKRQSLQSINKLKKLERYLSLAFTLPFISLIGLSGGVAMASASKKDDVDLFIITSPGRLWIGRFCMLVIAQILGVRRRRQEKNVNNTVCLNLFFDGRDLTVPVQKRNLYVAHEVLQMKPLFERSGVYSRFVKANDWVFEIFPNSRLLSSRVPMPYRDVAISNRLPHSLRSLAITLGDIFEYIIKKFQLYFINKHRTTELITPTQLWFFPMDMEKKLREEKLI